MQCPKCQFENVDGAKFCNECGCKLEISCPECSKINPPGCKFCNECGQNLTSPQEPAEKELSFDEKIDNIQRYLPKGQAEKILSQRDRIEGERKQVTGINGIRYASSSLNFTKSAGKERMEIPLKLCLSRS